MPIRIGELLLVNGLISREQLNKAIKIQRETGKKIGSILVEMGAISEDMLLKILTDKFGVSTVDLNNFVIQDNILSLLPGDFCRKNHIIPIDKFSNNISVVMEDPFDEELKKQIERLTGLKVDPLISSQHSIQVALDKYYPRTDSEETVASPQMSGKTEEYDIKNQLPDDDDIDTILGFKTPTDEEVGIKKKTPPTSSAPQPKPKPTQQQTQNISMGQNIVAPEIEALSKQQAILKEKVEKLKNDSATLVNNFNKLRNDLNSRLALINKYFTKLKPLEGKYDVMLNGMKGFYQKYAKLLEDIKSIKQELLNSKVDVENIKNAIKNEINEIEKFKNEYESMNKLVDEEREKLSKSISDKRLRHLINSKIFHETYQGEDIKTLKEKAQKVYSQNILFRNILLALIIILLGINVFFIVTRKNVISSPAKSNTYVAQKTTKKVQPKPQNVKKNPVVANNTGNKIETKTQSNTVNTTNVSKNNNQEQTTPTKTAKTETVKAKPQVKTVVKANTKPEIQTKPKPKLKPKPIVYRYRLKLYSSADSGEINEYKSMLINDYGLSHIYVKKVGSAYILYSGNYKTEKEAKKAKSEIDGLGLFPSSAILSKFALK